MRFQDRVILVTGATSGIGKAAAEAFAREGGRVGVLGRTKEDVQKVTEAIKASSGQAIELVADVSDPQQVEASVRELVAIYERLDVVFANAGINGVWAPIDELTPEEWDQTLDINLKGTFLTMKYAIPYLKVRGGVILVTSSINGTRVFSTPGAAAYATSKAGQVALTKMAALQLGKFKIRVNAICPGAIETEIHDNTEKRNVEEAREPSEFPEGEIPLTDGQPGTAEQVADLALFLASDAAVHISGTEMWIDGAQSLLRG